VVAHSPNRLEKCAVVDKKNWKRYIGNFQIGFTDGKYIWPAVGNSKTVERSDWITAPGASK
jgi:hypothetical protein